MRIDSIFLIGAGGHGKVVLDALLLNRAAIGKIYICDNDAALSGKALFGFPISIPAIHPSAAEGSFHIAIGNGKIRQQLYGELIAMGSKPLTVAHSSAVISQFSVIGAGNFIAANTIIGPDAHINEGVIVNHGAVVDHDCRVGAFSHIAPNATLAGAVSVGARVLIGAGANVLPNIAIGDDAIIGAGAVVLRDIAAGEVYAGVPATRIGRSKSD